MENRAFIQRPTSHGLVFSLPLTGGFTSGVTFWDDTQAYTATATNSPTPQYPGFDFVSASSMYIDVGAGPSTVSTVLLWFKPDGVAGTDTIIDLNGTDYLTVETGTLTQNGFAGGTSVLYVDGVAAANTITTAWHHIAITDTVAKNASDLDIGRKDAAYTDGLIADVLLYNRVLSAEEIDSIYHFQKYKYQVEGS